MKQHSIMEEIFFYNWERKTIMRWFNPHWCEVAEKGIICFEIEVSKSIFEALVTIRTNSNDLMNFKEDLNSLYNQTLQKVTYASCDGVLTIKLSREKSGRIYQTFCICNPKGKSGLTINDYFDQTFLPELEKSIINILK